MARDSQRYRKTYSYYRVQPKTELLEVIVDESLDWKNSARAASTGNVSLTGAGTTLSFGGVTIVDEDRVLLKDQSTASQNGIYYFEVSGGNYNFTRASDAKQGTLSSGATVYVEEGTNSGKLYILSTTGTIAVDSTSLTWTEFTGGAGGGLSGTGTAYKHARFSAASTIESSLLEDGIGEGPTGLPFPLVPNFLTSSAAGFHFPNAQRWTVAPSNTRALVINEDGFVFNASARSVGIGTANPADPLHIAHYSFGSDSAFIGSSMRTIRLQNTSTTAGNSTSIVNIGNVGIGNSDINAHISFVNLGANSAAITFGTKQNASSFGERMRIDEAGNVGIGSITPTSIGADVFLFVSGSSGSLGTSTRGVAAFGGDVIVSGSLKVGTGSVFITSNDIQFGSSAMRIQRSSSDMTFFANSSESFRIKSGGNIGINTNNPSEKLHVNSGNVKVDTTGYGIILPSSPTNVGAQTLDCYLETEMEVSLVCSSEGTMTLNPAYDMLRMTRIGRSVHLQGKLKVDATNATAGGDLWIALSGTGIPDNGTFDSAGSVYLTGFSASLVEPVYAIIDAGGNKIYLRRFYQGSLVSDLANYIAKGSGTAEIIISITYSI